MNVNEILEKQYKGKYDIKITGNFPLKVSVMHNNLPVWSVALSRENMIEKVFEESGIERLSKENTDFGPKKDDAIDEKFNEIICLAVDALKSDIDKGFVDRFITMQKNKNLKN